MFFLRKFGLSWFLWIVARILVWFLVHEVLTSFHRTSFNLLLFSKSHSSRPLPGDYYLNIADQLLAMPEGVPCFPTKRLGFGSLLLFYMFFHLPTKQKHLVWFISKLHIVSFRLWGSWRSGWGLFCWGYFVFWALSWTDHGMFCLVILQMSDFNFELSKHSSYWRPLLFLKREVLHLFEMS